MAGNPVPNHGSEEMHTHVYQKFCTGCSGQHCPAQPQLGGTLEAVCPHTERDVAKPWPRTRAQMDSQKHSVDLNKPNALHSCI